MDRTDPLAPDVRRQPGAHHHRADDVLEIVLDHPVEDRGRSAAKPGPIPARRLEAGHVVDAAVVEQGDLGVAEGAGAQPFAEQAAHRSEKVSVEPGMDTVGVEPVDSATSSQDGDVEAAPVVCEPQPVRTNARRHRGEERGLLARVDEQKLLTLESLCALDAQRHQEGHHPAAAQSQALDVEHPHPLTRHPDGPQRIAWLPEQIEQVGDRRSGCQAGAGQERRQVEGPAAHPRGPPGDGLGVETQLGRAVADQPRRWPDPLCCGAGTAEGGDASPESADGRRLGGGHAGSLSNICSMRNGSLTGTSRR